MRLFVRRRWPGLVLAAVAVGCSVTENSSKVIVEVTQSDSLVARGVIEKGKFDSVTARAVQSPSAGDTQAVHNVTFSWSTSDANIARVEPTGPASAQVVGVGAGYVTISATASGFDGAPPGTTKIRVSAAVHIDSIRPTTVTYGAKLTVYGVGVNNIFGITLGPGELISDIYAFRGYKGGIGESDWWVPFPANDHRSVIRFAGGDSLKDSTLIKVLPWDVYEPNDWNGTATDTPRVRIDVNGAGGPRTVAGFPALFYNPALYFEPGDTIADSANYFNDWYKFVRTDTTLPVSYQLSVPQLSDSTFTYFTSSLSDYFYSVAGNWIVNLGNWYDCNNGSFYPDGRFLPTSPRLALQRLPDTTVEVLSFYQNPGRYTLQVVQGYVSSDQRITPDRFEPDDIWCRYVDARFNNSTDSTSPTKLHIVVGKAFGGWYDTLALENPGALDVIRFHVLPHGVADSTYLNIQALPFLGETDRSQWSAQIFAVGSFGAPGTSTDGGGYDPNNSTYPYYYPCPYSTAPICLYWLHGYPYGYGGNYYPNGLAALLPAGDYYLVVADQAGNATRYSICVTVGAACVPPGAPPAVAPPPGARIAPAGAPTVASVVVAPSHRASDFLKQRLGARPQLRRR